ncbi:MAG: tetratricopeptide repeat protein [Desulfobacterales bacterium]|nr:tetratricopeptide repeat protein [Desulfobacterales bacterium]
MSDNYLAIKKFDEGVAAYLKGDFKSSIKLFSEAIKYDPKFALVHTSRGAAYLKSGKTLKAITDFNCALQLNSADARTFHLRGLAHEKAGDVARAYRDFDRALEIDPDLVAAYRGRDCVTDKSVAECWHQKEDYEMADHLAAMRVSHLAGHSSSRNPRI